MGNLELFIKNHQWVFHLLLQFHFYEFIPGNMCIYHVISHVTGLMTVIIMGSYYVFQVFATLTTLVLTAISWGRSYLFVLQIGTCSTVVEAPKVSELVRGRGVRPGWFGAPGPSTLTLQSLASCCISVCDWKGWLFLNRGWLGKWWYIHTALNEREIYSVLHFIRSETHIYTF